MSRLAVLFNPANPGHPLILEAAKAAAPSLGIQLLAVKAGASADFESAFAAMTTERAGGLFVPWDGTFLVHATRITQLAAKTRLPTMYGQRRYVDIGGLACYGPSASESFRRAAAYVDKILKRHEGRRSPGRAADQVRAHYQPEDRQGLGAEDS